MPFFKKCRSLNMQELSGASSSMCFPDGLGGGLAEPAQGLPLSDGLNIAGGEPGSSDKQ